MKTPGNEEASGSHEARIPSSSLENFQGLTNRLSMIRKIQDREEMRRNLEELLRGGRIKGTKESLEDEIWRQLARLDTEQPTKAEQNFTRESSHAASKVAGNLEDLNTPSFEGLIIRTDGNGNVTDILVKKVLPQENAEKARSRKSLMNLPSGPGKKLLHVPDAPPNALKTRIP